MSEEIESLRGQIDDIDRQMVELFKQRMDVSARVAEYKRARGLPVLAAGRERALLGKVADQAGEELGDYIQSVYRSILAASRSYQSDRLGRTSQVYATIRQALESTPDLFPQRPTAACQGIEGAYSQIACDRLFKAPKIQFYPSFGDVFQAVEDGSCQYGVLPIENSTAGSVNAVYDLMVRHNCWVVRSARLKVSHNLLARPGVRLEDVKEVVSHEQALHQCAGCLSRLGVKITVAANTAMAAKLVADSERTDLAVLSSRFCAEHYGLHILQEDVQDQDNNYTRFLCISKKPEIYPGADRISLMMVLAHRPGSLYRVLETFNAMGVNILKLESRPLPSREFEFMFYFDVELSVYAPEVEKLFLALEGECERLRYLGTYNEVIC